MIYFTISFLTSFVISFLLIRMTQLGFVGGIDDNIFGAQKFHVIPVSRLGGVGIFLSLFLIILVAYFNDSAFLNELSVFLGCGMPIFLAGIFEDVFQRVNQGIRLSLALLSSFLLCFFLNAGLTKMGIIGLDFLLSFTFFSLALTSFMIAGIVNSINIIDGFNGLASVISIMIFSGLGYVSFHLNDRLIFTLSVSSIGALCGFFLWNYPRGLIFLGDCGAYFIGYIVGGLSVLLVVRNPVVSVYFPFLLCLYPIFETVFSIYRKIVIRGSSPMLPDKVHLHMLIHKRLVRCSISSTDVLLITKRNSLTSPYLWVLSSLASVPAIIFWQSEYMLQIFIFIFIFIYFYFYRSLVFFKIQKYFSIKK